MADVLVLFATREGQTAKIARRMAGVLEAKGHRVEMREAGSSREMDLGRYRAIFVGSPIRMGHYLPSVVRFVKERRKALQRVPSAFFSVSLAVAHHQNSERRNKEGRAESMRVVQKFTRKTGWNPRRVELIAGALPYSKYGFLIRFVMRRISAHAGGDTDTSRDYEYTDWAAVDRFASEFVDEVVGSPVRPGPKQATA